MMKSPSISSGSSAPLLDHTSSQSISDELQFESCSFSLRQDSVRTSSRTLFDKSEQRIKERTSDLTINKLRRENLEIRGREKERQVLDETLKKCIQNQKQVLFVKGVSGTGKSALVTSHIQSHKSLRHGVYATAKFSLQNQQQEPYFGITSACRDICRELIQRNMEEEIRDALKEGLDSNDARILTSVISPLQELLGAQSKEMLGSPPAPQPMVNQETKHRFEHALLVLIRILVSSISPIVLILDDCQWSDPATLEFVQVLANDPKIEKGLMIVGLYRSNEMCQGLISATAVLEEKSQDKDAWFGLTTLEMGNLELEAVNDVLVDLLSMEGPDILALAEFCLKRTQGNAYFLLSFIFMLEEQKFLNYNFGVMRWLFDLKIIEEKTSATLNVVDMTRAKMNSMGDAFLDLLQIAACIGSSFDASSIDAVWKDIGREERLGKLLDIALQEGFFEDRAGESSELRWTHDNLQECGLSLIATEAERLTLQFRIGRILARELDRRGNIFPVVELLNSGINNEVLTDDESLEIARLNLLACKKAIQLSAFDTALAYAGMGITVLPKDHSWEGDNGLALDLYSTASELTSFSGEVDQLQWYSDAVIKRQTLPLLDKLTVHRALIHSTFNQLKIQNAIDMSFDLLRKLGCRFSNSKTICSLQTVAMLIRMRSVAQKITSKDAFSLPICNEPSQVATIELLSQLLKYLFHLEDPAMSVLVIGRAVEMSLRHGLIEMSPHLFVSAALMIGGAFNDFRLVSSFHEFAITAEKRLSCSLSTQCQLALTGAMVSVWTRPWRTVARDLETCIEQSRRCGNSETLAWAIWMFLGLSFGCGKALADLDAEFGHYLPEQAGSGNITQERATTLLWSAVANLRGPCDNPCSLVSRELNQGEIDKLKSTFPAFIVDADWSLIRLCCYCGEYERGADIALSMQDMMKTPQRVGWYVPLHVFTKALCCYGMARQKRKYRKAAMKWTQSLSDFVKKGNPNAQHLELLLQAEKAALRSPHQGDKVRHLYEQAVALSARSGFVQDAGLANERYAEYLISVSAEYLNSNSAEKDLVDYRLKEAFRFFSEWGSETKCRLMQEKYKDINFAIPRPGASQLGDN